MHSFNGDILRKDDKLNNVETVDIEGMKIGQELFATYIQRANLEIFGEQRNLFLVNCVFGAEVKNIEICEDGKKRIFFKDSEKRPMIDHTVSLSYLNSNAWGYRFW